MNPYFMETIIIFLVTRVERKTLIPNNTFNRIKRASTDEIQQAIDTYIYDDRKSVFFE